VSASPTTHTLTGTMTLTNGGKVYQSATSCRGDGGYEDINSATLQAVVKDDKGAIVGTSGVTSVRPPKSDDRAVEFDNQSRCFFNFEVRDLPDAPFYSIELGHRGAVTYSKADLEKASWKVDVELGGDE
jgi:hypothetical protein